MIHTVLTFDWIDQQFLGLVCISAEVKARKKAEAEGILLSTEVPKGATGEVARVLGCDNYFDVLEVPREAEANDIKKAHR